MNIVGINRFWFKTTIDKHGKVQTVLAVLTNIPLTKAEVDYDPAEATRLLEELRAFQLANNIDHIEVLRGTM